MEGRGGKGSFFIEVAHFLQYGILISKSQRPGMGGRWELSPHLGGLLPFAVSLVLLFAERALALAQLTAREEEVAAIGGFEWFGVAAGALALGALVRGLHSRLPR